MREKINQLASKNIAILTCNSKMDKINDFCFIGQDHYKGGRAAAGLMLKLIPSNGLIGLIISSHYLSCHPDRLRGFSDRVICHDLTPNSIALLKSGYIDFIIDFDMDRNIPLAFAAVYDSFHRNP